MFGRAENELWIWTELLAFDSARPDFGVKDYLAEAGKIPTGISFLTGFDFVMLHEPLGQGRVLPPQVCSRAGHLTNGRRERQAWTDLQVRGLVGELHRYGIKVVFSVFQVYLDDFFSREFLSDAHPEKRSALIAPMRDGRLMGDHLIEKVVEAMTDYGFDGWHAADDIAAPWTCIESPTDDLIRQFAEERGLPAFLLENADHDDAARRRKLRYLQTSCWREWNDFLLAAWKRFWEKAVRAVHGAGRILLVNSPNTKSVFGALQYMNVDYRQLAEFGADYLVSECCTSSCALVWHNRPLLHEFAAMTAELTASMPNVKVLIMPAVRDRVEGFDVFAHALPRFERDLHVLNAQGIWRDGELRRCADGFMFCLGDCVEAAEWKRFHEMYARSTAFDPVRSGELVWLVDPKAFDALHEEHHRFGTWSPSLQITKLKNLRSIDISAIATPPELPHIMQPLIVPNFHLLTEADRRTILSLSVPLVLTGNFPGELPPGAEAIRWRMRSDFVWCCLFLNWPGQRTGRVAEVVPQAPPAAFDETKPFSKYRELYPHLDMPEDFWRTAADRIRELLGPLPIENEAEGVQLVRQYAADGTEHRLQISHADHYVIARCRVEPDGAEVAVAGSWPPMPLCVKDGRLAHGDRREIPVMIPPHGLVATDIRRK